MSRALNCALAILSATCAISPKVFAGDNLVSFSLRVAEDGRGISGSVTYSGLAPGSDYCLVSAFNDSAFGQKNFFSKFEFLKRLPPPKHYGGTMRLSGGWLEDSTAEHTPFMAKASTLTVEVEGNLPLPTGADEKLRVFESFLPRLADGCVDKPSTRRFIGTITPPTSWRFVAPFDPASIDFEATDLSFALTKDKVETTENIAGTPVRIFTSQSHKDKVAPIVVASFYAMQDWFGEAPYKEFAVVESSDLHSHALSGLIIINLSETGLLNRIQGSFLNWMDWVITSSIATQWFGATLQAENDDFRWLPLGLAEYVTQEILRRQADNFDLFNPFNSGYKPFTFSYRQYQDVIATVVKQYSPFNRLVNEDFTSAQGFQSQNPANFIRLALSLRHIRAVAGEWQTRRLVQSTYRKFRTTPISPRGFLDLVQSNESSLSTPHRAEAARLLQSWWMTDGWPDFRLDEVKVEKDESGKTFLIRAFVAEIGEISSDVDVSFFAEGQSPYVVRAKRGGETRLVAEAVLPYKPEWVEVDAQRYIYDSNRFDNTNAGFGVAIFPGNARTLEDDQYTVVWLPFFQRRPGEAFALGLAGSLFRYIEGGLIATFEFAPSTNQTEVNARYKWRSVANALHGELRLIQDFENLRRFEVSATRAPLFSGPVHAGLDLKLRHTGTVGAPETYHPSLVVGGTIRPEQRLATATAALDGASELSPDTGEYRYVKYSGSLLVSGVIRSFLSLSLRAFRGYVARTGEVPTAVNFKVNDVDSVRIRIDRSGIPREPGITAVGFDADMPLFIPLPNSGVLLGKSARFRGYYDYGKSPAHEYRASGVGVALPLGGDLAGTGSLAVSKLSTIVVLYSAIDQSVSRKPGVLVDVKGEF